MITLNERTNRVELDMTPAEAWKIAAALRLAAEEYEGFARIAETDARVRNQFREQARFATNLADKLEAV